MKKMKDFSGKPWWNYLDKVQQDLIKQSLYLVEDEEKRPQALTDYSFVVFPAAKAYEGFLKKYLFVQGLINVQTYEGRRFRIGRSLNPDVHMDQRDEFWLYDDIVRICGDQTAREVWDVWLKCRNQVFHYFVKDPKQLSLEQARAYQNLIIDVMKKLASCINH